MMHFHFPLAHFGGHGDAASVVALGFGFIAAILVIRWLSNSETK
jgi:hypothetical protein